MKKYWFLVLLFCLFALPALGEEITYTSGDYQYLLLEDGSCMITKYTGNEPTLTIPKQLDGHTVSVIGTGAFSQNKTLSALYLPQTVTTLQKEAIYQCSSLKNVYLPDSLIHLEPRAILSCNSLSVLTVSPNHPLLFTIDGVLFSKPDKTLLFYPKALPAAEYTVPNGILHIAPYAFLGCNLEKITISDSVQSIGAYAFSASTQMQSIRLSQNLKHLGDSALTSCSSLTSIQLPEGLLSIGANAFEGCMQLSSLTLPSTLESIGDLAFRKTPLVSLSVPDSLKEIGINPFCQVPLERLLISPTHPYLAYSDGMLYSKADKRLVACLSDRETFAVPQGIEIIGGYAFYGRASLQSITFPQSLTTLGTTAFYACKSLKSIVLPDGVQNIEDWVFCNCTHLASINIPEGVTYLGINVLRDTALTELTLPGTLKTLGDYALKISSLTAVNLPESLESISSSAFSANNHIMFTVAIGSQGEAYCQQKGFTYKYPDASLDWLNN